MQTQQRRHQSEARKPSADSSSVSQGACADDGLSQVGNVDGRYQASLLRKILFLAIRPMIFIRF
jgi:hypothetical protein